MDFVISGIECGKLNALVKNIMKQTGIADPAEAVRRVNAGELVVSIPTPSEFPVWKTIKLGTGLRTADDFRTALKKNGNRIGDPWGDQDDIIGMLDFTAIGTETEVDLVVVPVGDLGFKGGAYHRDIISKALEFGLELCPAEVGPQLRLQYEDQLKVDWRVIGMEPITDAKGHLHGFSVGHDDFGRWLSSVSGAPKQFWRAAVYFVFVKPRR